MSVLIRKRRYKMAAYLAQAGMMAMPLASIAAEPIGMEKFMRLPDKPVSAGNPTDTLAAANIEQEAPLATESAAQPESPAAKGYIELGGQRYLLSGGERRWAGSYVRGAWVQNEKNVWNYEVVSARRFGDSGIFANLGLTRTFNEDWYGSLALGTSSGGFFWPRYRVDAFLHRKLMKEKNLVVTLGLTDYRAKDVHSDHILHLGADYYFDSPWVVSAEFLVNHSSPGGVNANYGFLSATYGHNHQAYLTLRQGYGKEAYQLLGDIQVITGFYSRVTTLTYRKWLTREWGINLVGEYYGNPLYSRRGIEIGIFKDF